MISLIVGLGNPGRKYADTRHNVAWFVLDRLVQKAGGRWDDSDPDFALCPLTVGARQVILARPMLYMNRSGPVVRQLLDRHEVELSQLLIVVDDFNLEWGVRPGSMRQTESFCACQSVCSFVSTVPCSGNSPGSFR